MNSRFACTWWREQDSNLRPLGYEPNELPLLHPAMFRGAKLDKIVSLHKYFVLIFVNSQNYFFILAIYPAYIYPTIRILHLTSIQIIILDKRIILTMHIIQQALANRNYPGEHTPWIGIAIGLHHMIRYLENDPII